MELEKFISKVALFKALVYILIGFVYISKAKRIVRKMFTFYIKDMIFFISNGLFQSINVWLICLKDLE